jgi:hypothetical protein
MRSYRSRFHQARINPVGKNIYPGLQKQLEAEPFTINYTPRNSVKDYNGPLSWIGKAEGENNKKYFCGEMSELTDISNMPRIHWFQEGDKIRVKNTKTGNVIVFECYSVDKSNDGEDIAGWNFKSIEGSSYPVDLLIIND